jgi:hypothetical protein
MGTTERDMYYSQYEQVFLKDDLSKVKDQVLRIVLMSNDERGRREPIEHLMDEVESKLTKLTME